jgi:hypothetical protein
MASASLPIAALLFAFGSRSETHAAPADISDAQLEELLGNIWCGKLDLVS